MSLKTHLIFNPFFLAYYKVNVDSYVEIWIFYSNLILQENTAEAKIPVKTRRDQSISRNEVATESWSRNKKLFVQLILGYDISRTSLEEEIEGLFK